MTPRPSASLTAFVARNTLHRRWRSYLGLFLLTAFMLGLALFTVAGARRTQSSYPRFLRAVHAATMSVTRSQGYDDKQNAVNGSLSEVAQSRTYVGFQVYVLAGGEPDFSRTFEASGTFDGRYFDQDRFTATEGRAPDPQRAEEVAVNHFAATLLGFRVGQQLELGTYSMDQFSDRSFYQAPPPPKLRTTATIVGIGVFPDEILQDEGDRVTRMLLTPAFSTAAKQLVTYGVQGLVLRNGDRDVKAVKQQLATLYPPGSLEIRTTAVDEFHALHATRPLALALGIFGVISGCATLVLVSQAVGTLVRTDRDLRAGLWTFGASPAATVRSSFIAPALAIAVGTAFAVAMAAAASPLMPIGPVRNVGAAGFDVDRTVLGFGSLAALFVLLAVSMGIALREQPHRLRRRQAREARSSTLVARAASVGVPPSAMIGLAMALEPGESSSAVSNRSVIAGAVIAIASLVAAVTFGSSLNTLVHQPKLYGWKWDSAVLAGDGYDKMPLDMARAVLDSDRKILGWSGAYFGFDAIDNQDIPLLGMNAGSAVGPPITKGRDILGPSEIVLGAATARRLHKTLGDQVTMTGTGTPHVVRVVGIATFPTIGIVHAAHTSLGVGALVAPELIPGFDRDITGIKQQGLGPTVIFIRYRPGTDPGAELRHLRDITKPLAGFAGLDVLQVQRPAEIASSRSIGSAPILLAIALAIATAISLILALRSSVRRRRRDLAVLRTLGFTRPQLAATVSWQATTIIALGLVVGLPVGAALGRVSWRLFAGQLDVVAMPTVPLVAIVGVAIAAVLIANAVSAIPGRTARNVDPSAELRRE